MQSLGGHRSRSLLTAAKCLEIKPRRFLDELMHRGPPPGRGEVNLRALVVDGGSATDLLTDGTDHLLGEFHHPDVVGIGLIDLHRGEFGVVAGADPLIAEDPAQFVDTLKATDHKALEVQLRGNPQGEGQIERVVVGLKGTGIGTTGFALEHRRFDLEKLAIVQPAADATHQPGPTAEGFAGVRRHDQIQITLAVALLHIGQPVPLVRQGLQRLAQHAPVAHLHRQLASIGPAQGSGHPQPVTGVDQ